MAPAKKAKKSPPGVFRKPVEPQMSTKVTALQENIRLIAKEVRGPIKTGKPGPKSSKVVPPAETIAEPVKKKQKKDRAPWENPYAREIFFCKTNIREIARQEVIEQRKYTDPAAIEADAKAYRYKLFQAYVETPEFRIRVPLYKLRFESEYYEYRLHLALAMRMRSDEDYQDYKVQLDAAGISESWVCMRKDNLLLQHEDKVLEKVRTGFKHWGSKLVKLPEYLMNAQRNYESKQAGAAAATLPLEPQPQMDPLLDALTNRSNARERIDVKEVYALLAGNPPRSLYRSLRWLVFEDDALNQRFGLQAYASDDDESESETMIGITPLDVSSVADESTHSEGSEFAQMRSEMAMTQPHEMRPVPDVGPFYQSTSEVITALEPTQQVESFALVQVESLVPPVDPLVSSEDALVAPADPLVEARDAIQPDEPVPQQPEASVNAVADIPEGHQSDGSELSLLTPGQQEVISISDDDDDDDQHQQAHRSPKTAPLSKDVKPEECFWADLDNVRRYTNLDEYITNGLKERYKNDQKKIERVLADLDKIVRFYFAENIDHFRRNELPEGVTKLTRRARREREALSQPAGPQVSLQTPAPQAAQTRPAPVPATLPTQTPPTVSTLEPLFNGALVSETQFETPRQPLRTKLRQIAYEESPPLLPATPDTMPMPDSENFQPEAHSTQNTFGGPMIGAAPGTPRPSPQRPTPPRRPPPQVRPSVDSRCSTPGFADENNVTVQDLSPRKRPSPRVKIERDNSGYADDVEEVPMDNRPIVLEDTIDQSQIDGMELIDRGEHAAIPLEMRNRMNGLFREEPQPDVTQLSQTSEKSGDGQRLSMGFRNSQSPRVRSD
ncbi:uncharacterized protein LOC6042230 [Culex quinquefasciatus]|uniref:uncharacterized protein LOC6042230 n=1 Tax=Culex quinquefasciatus TaxID=7176 RepID=UPI0018E3A51B|nr:uncharacterized protein LOC6042230 [Culex quinquefasciatus]